MTATTRLCVCGYPAESKGELDGHIAYMALMGDQDHEEAQD